MLYFKLESTAERRARRNNDIKTLFQSLTIEEGMPFMEAYEAVDQLHQDPASNIHKLLRNGQVLILRGDRTYTVTGQEIK